VNTLPLGKLPSELLAKILTQAPISDPRVVLGPGIGLDCAVVDMGDSYLVFKSDPITFATDEIGWYAVQVNANDIATTGATPRWFMVTALLPEGVTTPKGVEEISKQLFSACQDLGISLIGGHTEITYGLDRPIIVGTMVGEVARDQLITPKGAMPGDRILLTKGIPIEGTAILTREFPERLKGVLSQEEIQEGKEYLFNPGISVVKDAMIATQAGKVTAMHDPTEGGLSGALWELAEACGHTLVIDPKNVFIPKISTKICQAFEIDPLATIASGALLLTTPPEHTNAIIRSLEDEGIACADIGCVEAGNVRVEQITPKGRQLLPRPERDEIAMLFER